ncbi:MAG: hypothetical protein R3B13_17175 [Polyangiaceae bacterium]
MRRSLPVALMLFGCEGVSPPGDLSKFTPVKSLAQVSGYAGKGSELTRLDIDDALPNGTVDLTADYAPKIRYTFRAPATERDISDLGAGPPGSAPKVGDWISVSVRVENSKYWCRGKDCATKGMERSVSRATVSEKGFVPACNLEELWKAARAAGAPTPAAADVKYSADGIDFEVGQPKFELKFDAHCKAKK